ncbi:C4-dicarboxylate ABC transporter [Nitrosomonas sp. sh817]|uniref:C4-dicarboxylate ABC transporter n=1 Tax=Nitrosomonas sp. sh817 TaxID=3070658 RepID=UPI0027DCE5CD|nr:C4-dicarboxylate ABC transporter [Nitrosomonas sp. sh817]WMJ07426.1 C4-dicarboxylate ABC transporter [Nitrosomonas sp. sh817]
MKTNQLVMLTVFIISGIFFGILSLFDLPASVTEWIISDVILGVILYISYLVITFTYGSSQRSGYRSNKRIYA